MYLHFQTLYCTFTVSVTVQIRIYTLFSFLICNFTADKDMHV